MKTVLKEKGILLLTFITFYFIIEMITFRWVHFSFLPDTFIIDFIFALGLGSVIFLIRSNKWAMVYMTFILGLVVTLFLINVTMYSVYFELFTLQQLTLIGEATGVFNFEFLSIPSIIVAVIYTIIYFVTLRIVWKKYLNEKLSIKKYYSHSLPIFATVIVFILLVFSLGIRSIQRYSNSAYITSFKRASLEEYGLFGYYYKEARVLVFGIEGDHTGDDGELIPYEKAYKSEYFGLLEGKNVITVLVESLQPFAVSEVLTPNLYKMTQEGIYFSNNYSENKTNVSEMIAINGNYPTIKLLPSSYEYNFQSSVPKVLNEGYGYNTAYFHDNYANFYERDKLMSSLGFDHFYSHDEMFPGQERWSWSGDYTLDSITVEKVIERMEFGDEPFYYNWATMIMHGPYNYHPTNIRLFESKGYFEAIDQATQNGDWFNPLEFADEKDRLRIRYYEAAVMDFDIALGKMLDALEENDELNDTVIVLFGDHNVYYHTLHLVMNDASEDEYYNMDLYKAFLSIYNPTLTKEYLKTHEDTKITKFTSPYNIAPTLYDLLGIEYNQNLLLGETVFSDHQEVFYTNKLTGFFDDNLYSDDGYDIIYNKNNVDEEYIEDFIATCDVLRYRLEVINYWYDKTKVNKAN